MEFWLTVLLNRIIFRNPNGDDLAEWPKYTAGDWKTLEFRNDAQIIGVGPRLRQCQFWKYYLPQVKSCENEEVVPIATN